MGKFRDEMADDLKIRGYSQKTQETYRAWCMGRWPS